ncbi:MAG: sigma-54 dependent transcriptional regulator [Nitrospirae bacterium]|nr:sigma-54 dependent transcriptional regulator [Nitrospirota bacterium]
MHRIDLITKDHQMKQELASVLPKGVKLAVHKAVPPDIPKGRIVFIDIDTFSAGLIKELSAGAFVVAVTKQKRTEPVMEAATFGAYEVIQRPLKGEAVSGIMEELQNLSIELDDIIPVSKENLPLTATCAIVGSSPVIMDVCKRLAQLAQVEVPVLITGETGTGKELVAEAIAQLSSRFGKPFVMINCAAVPEALLESELFGFEKGAFTGAFAPKEGMLKIADEGCVFFDEIGELPLALQGKLLRFLQTQTFYPIGSTKEVQVNVRVISATNRDLSRMVLEGRFREDLFHRLSVATIHAPSLRERKKDILSLVNFFIYRYRDTVQRPIKGITKAFLKKLHSHGWPGNIRELQNVIRSAIALSKTPYLTTYELKELGRHSTAKPETSLPDSLSSAIVPYLKEALERGEYNIYERLHKEVDKTLLDYILSYTKENQSEAARILGINRLTLRKKLGMGLN